MRGKSLQLQQQRVHVIVHLCRAACFRVKRAVVALCRAERHVPIEVLDFACLDSHTSGLKIPSDMNSDKLQIILASASPRREHLLREMGLRFTVVRPNDVEELLGGAAPDVVAMQNAQRKARAVA